MVTGGRRVCVGRRGQLLLAGAFVLAVGIIGLTFVLNTSVQTDSLAESETGVARGSGALSMRGAVRADLGDFLDTVNQQYGEDTGSDPWENYRDAYRDGLPPLARGVRDHHAGGGRLVNVSAPATLGTAFDDGYRVTQDSTDSFAEPGTSPPVDDWRVVSASTVRNVTFTFDRELSPSNPAFRVVFDETGPGGTTWALEVYEQPTASGNWELQLYVGGSPVDSCTGPPRSERARLDVAAAQFGNEYCSALDRLEPAGPYNVGFRNGDNVRGQFWLIVDRQGPDGTPPSPTPPVLSPQIGGGSTASEPVLYGLQVTYSYHSSTVDYEAPLVIAPGEV